MTSSEGSSWGYQRPGDVTHTQSGCSKRGFRRRQETRARSYSPHTTGEVRIQFRLTQVGQESSIRRTRSCRRGHVRVTTSWSIPNSPPGSPQASCLRAVLFFAARCEFSRYARGFFFGTPFVWQSAHLTVWTLWGLLIDLNVVSMVSTLSPQFESCGWQVTHDARVFWPCFSWQAKQLRPSWTPMGGREIGRAHVLNSRHLGIPFAVF